MDCVYQKGYRQIHGTPKQFAGSETEKLNFFHPYYSPIAWRRILMPLHWCATSMRNLYEWLSFLRVEVVGQYLMLRKFLIVLNCVLTVSWRSASD